MRDQIFLVALLVVFLLVVLPAATSAVVRVQVLQLRELRLWFRNFTVCQNRCEIFVKFQKN